MPTLEAVLREAQLSQHLSNFYEVGISSPVDLIHLTVDDFATIGVEDPSEKKRLTQLIQAIKSSESQNAFPQPTSQPKTSTHPRSASQNAVTPVQNQSISKAVTSNQRASSPAPGGQTTPRAQLSTQSSLPRPASAQTSNIRPTSTTKSPQAPSQQQQQPKAIVAQKTTPVNRPSSGRMSPVTPAVNETQKSTNPKSTSSSSTARSASLTASQQSSRSSAISKEIQEFLDLSNGLVKIRVTVRKRPLNPKEIKLKQVDAMDMPTSHDLIVLEQRVKVDLTKYTEKYEFSFDECIGAEASKEEVYGRAVRPLVSAIFKQARTTCFAYGQTGSGKTFTMAPMPIMAAHDVMKVLSLKQYKHLKAVVSVFEIYLSMVFDLMNDRRRLVIREDSAGIIHIVGLEEIEMTSINVLNKVLENAEKVRSSAPTHANANSSRSHQVLQIILKDGESVYGKMSFIDLAGSEWGADIKDTNRQTRMEGAEINKSLLALKECIRALDRDSSHIPFRGSKLTEVLKDSFIGNSFTMMMACVSPASGSVEHSLNTLRYADRVKELRQTKDKSVPYVDPLTPGVVPRQGIVVTQTSFPKQNQSIPENEIEQYEETDNQLSIPSSQNPNNLSVQLRPQPVNETRETRRSVSFVVRDENERDLVAQTAEDENLRMHDELIDTILLEEEQLLSDHRTEIEQTMRLVKEEMRLLDMMDNPGAQVDDYVAQLDVVLQNKIKIVNELREKLKIFQEHLQEEDQMSKAFTQQSYSRHY